MEIKILAFGIAKDIVSGNQTSLILEEASTVGTLKAALCAKFPEFEKLRSLSIAVNADYQTDDFKLSPSDEVVIIPPVSGG